MLRHYDEINLLKPKSINYLTNYRYYNENQLVVATRITALKNMGFSLAVISEILISYGDSKKLSEFLCIKKKETSSNLEQTKYRLQLLESTIKRLREDENTMSYEVIFKEMPQRYVASVRKVVNSYQDEGILWGILMQETANLKIKQADPCYSLAIFHDKEYKENNVDVEIQIMVDGSYQNTQNVTFKTENSVKIASATFKGGYENMDKVNESVANWVSDNGYDFDGPMFNIYHVSPNETKNADEYITEVCYPVIKK